MKTYRIFILGERDVVTASLTWTGDDVLDDSGLANLEPTRTKEVWQDARLIGRIAPRLTQKGDCIH